MDNKKYLDKVLRHMVKGTKIDYDKGEIIFPFTTNYTPFSMTLPHLLSFLLFPFIEYCVNHFGLIPDEVDYLFKQYREIIEDKIKKWKIRNI